MKRMVPVALVVHLIGQDLLARDLRIEAEFRSPHVGMFKYTRTLTGREAERIGHPTEQTMRPYLVAAQKALAEREGYPEQSHGADNHKLLTGVKFYGLVVTEVGSGQELYSSN